MKGVIFSPLEQFQVIPIFPLTFGVLDFTITNVTVIIFAMLCILVLFIKALLSKDGTLKVIPGPWQVVVESIYLLVLSLVTKNIAGKEAQKYFPIVFTIFFSILILNLTGLVPYSFTITSHLIVTFVISFSVFIGINIICIKKHGIKIFSLFLPPGTSIILALLLVPVEFISYVFKPISLGVRLFANMMAGHILLKVIAGFAFALVTANGVYFIAHMIPLIILVPLYMLELAIAIIQAFVFSMLVCIYINDALNLH